MHRILLSIFRLLSLLGTVGGLSRITFFRLGNTRICGRSFNMRDYLGKKRHAPRRKIGKDWRITRQGRVFDY